jgi:phosphohistidine phosphatase
VSAAPAAAGRTLWLLRHAKAMADPPAGGDDFDRVLAPRGRRDAEALGRLIGRGGYELGVSEPLPQVAFVSPAARTAATADLVLTAAGLTPRLEYPTDLYGGDPEDVLNHLRRLDTDVDAAMVVLHNPTGHHLADGLLERTDEDGLDLLQRRGFPTCALAVIRLEVARWSNVESECGVLFELFTPPFGES